MAVSEQCLGSMLPIVFFFYFAYLVMPANSADYDSLLALKSSIDPSNTLPWPRGSDVCRWRGVKACLKGRVSKLVVEFRGLNGSLEGKSLNQLDQLRVLSFKANSLSGPIPDLRGLINLKSLYLHDNRLSGEFPASITTLHRLKTIVFSGNNISGEIPASLTRLARLYSLLVQDNLLTGEVPPLNQSSLTFLNVSNNRLSGKVPATAALLRFNSSSFTNNLNLCGSQVNKNCTSPVVPSTSPPTPSSINPHNNEGETKPKKKKKKKKLIIALVSSIAGFILLIICIVVLWIIFKRRKAAGEKGKAAEEGAAGGVAHAGAGEASGGSEEAKGGLAWEEGGVGSLVFCAGAGEEKMVYTMEDLLRASAETLGRGTAGSTYKAVMESGFIVTVKRLRDVGGGRPEEFRLQAEALGRLRHPNLVPLRAYFQAKEERLLVYDYYPNGSLFSLIHGMFTYPNFHLSLATPTMNHSLQTWMNLGSDLLGTF